MVQLLLTCFRSPTSGLTLLRPLLSSLLLSLLAVRLELEKMVVAKKVAMLPVNWLELEQLLLVEMKAGPAPAA
jgi:hypothetical protein